jgi:hypothetical protein
VQHESGPIIFFWKQTKFDRPFLKQLRFSYLVRVENNMSSNNGLPIKFVTDDNTNGQMDLTGLATQLGINAAIAVGVILAFNILRPNHSRK